MAAQDKDLPVGERRELPSDVAAALAELKEALSRIYGEQFKGLYLFGSYARGDFRPESSDVDVLVMLEGDVRPGEELGRYSGVVSDIDLKYDVVLATVPVPARWLWERKSPLFENVRREGVRL